VKKNCGCELLLHFFKGIVYNFFIMKKKFLKGEISTIITLGTLIVLGVSSLVSYFLFEKKQITKTKATEATLGCIQTVGGSQYIFFKRSDATPVCDRSEIQAGPQNDAWLVGSGPCSNNQACGEGRWCYYFNGQYQNSRCLTRDPSCDNGSCFGVSSQSSSGSQSGYESQISGGTSSSQTQGGSSSQNGSTSSTCRGVNIGRGPCNNVVSWGSCAYRGESWEDRNYFNQWVYCCYDGNWYAKSPLAQGNPKEGWQTKKECEDIPLPTPSSTKKINPPKDDGVIITPQKDLSNNCFNYHENKFVCENLKDEKGNNLCVYYCNKCVPQGTRMEEVCRAVDGSSSNPPVSESPEISQSPENSQSSENSQNDTATCMPDRNVIVEDLNGDVLVDKVGEMVPCGETVLAKETENKKVYRRCVGGTQNCQREKICGCLYSCIDKNTNQRTDCWRFQRNFEGTFLRIINTMEKKVNLKSIIIIKKNPLSSHYYLVENKELNAGETLFLDLTHTVVDCIGVNIGTVDLIVNVVYKIDGSLEEYNVSHSYKCEDNFAADFYITKSTNPK
jgi:hypothetical protein